MMEAACAFPPPLVLCSRHRSFPLCSVSATRLVSATAAPSRCQLQWIDELLKDCREDSSIAERSCTIRACDAVPGTALECIICAELRCMQVWRLPAAQRQLKDVTAPGMRSDLHCTSWQARGLRLCSCYAWQLLGRAFGYCDTPAPTVLLPAVLHVVDFHCKPRSVWHAIVSTSHPITRFLYLAFGKLPHARLVDGPSLNARCHPFGLCRLAPSMLSSLPSWPSLLLEYCGEDSSIAEQSCTIRACDAVPGTALECIICAELRCMQVWRLPAAQRQLKDVTAPGMRSDLHCTSWQARGLRLCSCYAWQLLGMAFGYCDTPAPTVLLPAVLHVVDFHCKSRSVWHAIVSTSHSITRFLYLAFGKLPHARLVDGPSLNARCHPFGLCRLAPSMLSSLPSWPSLLLEYCGEDSSIAERFCSVLAPRYRHCRPLDTGLALRADSVVDCARGRSHTCSVHREICEAKMRFATPICFLRRHHCMVGPRRLGLHSAKQVDVDYRR